MSDDSESEALKGLDGAKKVADAFFALRERSPLENQVKELQKQIMLVTRVLQVKAQELLPPEVWSEIDSQLLTLNNMNAALNSVPIILEQLKNTAAHAGRILAIAGKEKTRLLEIDPLGRWKKLLEQEGSKGSSET